MKLELRYNTSENHKNTAVAVQDMLKPFGFDVTLVNTDGKSHYSYLEQKGDFDLARAGWIADYKDPVTFLNLGQTGDGNNYGEYSNAEFDKLTNAAAVEADPAKRMELLAQAEALLVADQSICRCSTTQRTMWCRPRSRALMTTSWTSIPRASSARIGAPEHGPSGNPYLSSQVIGGRGPDLHSMLRFFFRRLMTTIPTLFLIVTFHSS